MKRLVAAIGAALLLATPISADAQSRKDALSTELAALVLEGPKLEAMLQTVGPEFGKAMQGQAWWKAEWTPLFEAAFREEMRADLPKFHAVFGRELTRGMTEKEVEAGLAVFRTEAGRLMLQSAAAGGARPRLTRAQEQELERVGTPAAMIFSTKMKRNSDMSDAAKTALVQELFPGVVRRFGEKAEGAAAR